MKPSLVLLTLLLCGISFLPAQRGIWHRLTPHHEFEITVDTTREYNEYTKEIQVSYSIPKVTVKDKGSEKVIQTIYPPDSEEIDYIHDSSLAVIIVDANFDGYMDIAIRDWPMMYLSTFSYYLYSPEKGKFILNEPLSTAYSPEIDPETKTFHHFWHIGVTTFSHQVYLLIDGKWELIAFEEEDNMMMQMDTTAEISLYCEIKVGNKMVTMPETGSRICHNMPCDLTRYALLMRRHLIGIKK